MAGFASFAEVGRAVRLLLPTRSPLRSPHCFGQTQFHRSTRGGRSRDPAGGRRGDHPRSLAACRTDTAAVQSVEIWGWFLACILISTCLRFVLQFRGQQMISAARASMIMCCEPVWVLIFALAFLGTPLSLSQVLGYVVIFLAMICQVALPSRSAA
ncbi:DMT family transporter [Ensifer sp. ENS05]|nr:DMT family transporter [Ensifer sp. ENS05]